MSNVREWPTEISGYPLLSVRFSAHGDDDLHLTANGWMTIDAIRDGGEVITSSDVVETESVTAIAFTENGTPVASVSLGLCAATEQPEYDQLMAMLKDELPSAIAAIKAEINAL